MLTLNEVLHSRTILRKEPNLLEIEGQKAIQELLVLRYLANYGDYVADLCKTFRDLASSHETDGFLYFCGGLSWKVVQEKLNEDAALKKWVEGGQRTDLAQPISEAINHACALLGMDIFTIRYAIKWYSERNSSMHSEMGSKIQQCDWQGLSARLWYDKHGLSLDFGEEELSQMKKALKMLEERYFLKIGPMVSVPSQPASDFFWSMRVKREHLEVDYMKVIFLTRNIYLTIYIL
jgi:hypothetical protein